MTVSTRDVDGGHVRSAVLSTTRTSGELHAILFSVLCAVRFCELRPRAPGREDLRQRDMGGDKVGKNRRPVFVVFHASLLHVFLHTCADPRAFPSRRFAHVPSDEQLSVDMDQIQEIRSFFFFFVYVDRTIRHEFYHYDVYARFSGKQSRHFIFACLHQDCRIICDFLPAIRLFISGAYKDIPHLIYVIIYW